jgi:hypothetical protein
MMNVDKFLDAYGHELAVGQKVQWCNRILAVISALEDCDCDGPADYGDPPRQIPARLRIEGEDDGEKWDDTENGVYDYHADVFRFPDIVIISA